MIYLVKNNNKTLNSHKNQKNPQVIYNHEGLGLGEF